MFRLWNSLAKLARCGFAAPATKRHFVAFAHDFHGNVFTQKLCGWLPSEVYLDSR
jgi:hypothetical protein